MYRNFQIDHQKLSIRYTPILTFSSIKLNVGGDKRKFTAIVSSYLQLQYKLCG